MDKQPLLLYNEVKEKENKSMSIIEVLPADSYMVINKSILNNEDRKILNMLYMPIIGPIPVILYFALWSDLDKSEVTSAWYNHHHLITTLHLSLKEITEARRKLEAIGLLKTYIKKDSVNNYIYELYSPLSVHEFLTHPILNIVLYTNVGKTEYERLIDYFKLPTIKISSYDNITASFDEIFTSIPLTSYEIINNDIRRENKLKLNINTNFDFDFLKASLPQNINPDKLLTKDIKELIVNLSYIYDLDTLHMSGIVKSAINERGTISAPELRKMARNYYQFDNHGLLPSIIDNSQPEYLRKPEGDSSKRAKMIYDFETISPYNFIKSRSNHAEPTKRDLKLIEDLIIDYGLKPGVVNVLIDYTLKTNDKKLNRSFVETIAGQWQRLKIETVEDAMKVAEKEHKKYKNKMPNKEKYVKLNNSKVPEWFDKSLEKTKTTKEEEEELKELLKEYQ